MRRPERQIGVGGIQLGEREKYYLNQVIQSNRLSSGPLTERFEALFAREHGCRFAIFCNSGTSALQMALAALKEVHRWKDGDEVLVPAVTFVATSNAVLHNNLVPVFVDVEPETYNMDPDRIEEKIGDRTRAVVPVHLFGLPAQMDRILDIAGRRGLRVVEDSCETMFASFRGQKVGSFGAIGCFSTYAAHLIVTGVGGFATTNDPALAVILKSLMNHGRDSIYLRIDDDQGVPAERLLEIVQRRFHFERVGFSYRATELEAAIGLAQLEQKDDMLRQRRLRADYLTRQLRNLEEFLQLPHTPSDRDHVFMMYPIVCRTGEKAALVNHLEVNGVETRNMLPLLTQPVYRSRFGDLEDEYPVAKWINRNGFYIGCHQYLTFDELEYVVGLFYQFFDRPCQGRGRPLAGPQEASAVKSTLVILTLDEIEAVKQLYERIPFGSVDECLVVDGNSTDGTREFFEEKSVRVISQSQPGRGEAFKEGMRSASGDVVVFFSGDGNERSGDIPALVGKIQEGYDLVIASRFGEGCASFDATPSRRFGNWLFTTLVNLRWGTQLTDVFNGFRAIRREKMQALNLTASHFEIELEMVIRGIKKGLRIAEVPTTELERIGGRPKLRTVRDGLKNLWCFLKEAVGS